MKRGCCGNCDGQGADASAPETSGLCWDCQGTGHPHLGPCGRWETFASWCWRHEFAAMIWILMWAWITTLLAVLPGAEPWAIYIIAVPVLIGTPACLAMGGIGARQVRRERERSHRA